MVEEKYTVKIPSLLLMYIYVVLMTAIKSSCNGGGKIYCKNTIPFTDLYVVLMTDIKSSCNGGEKMYCKNIITSNFTFDNNLTDSTKPCCFLNYTLDPRML